jgi:Na+/H+-dicarboxylate symporter
VDHRAGLDTVIAKKNYGTAGNRIPVVQLVTSYINDGTVLVHSVKVHFVAQFYEVALQTHVLPTISFISCLQFIHETYSLMTHFNRDQ